MSFECDSPGEGREPLCGEASLSTEMLDLSLQRQLVLSVTFGARSDAGQLDESMILSLSPWAELLRSLLSMK